jgi:hypothetical protein
MLAQTVLSPVLPTDDLHFWCPSCWMVEFDGD